MGMPIPTLGGRFSLADNMTNDVECEALACYRGLDIAHLLSGFASIMPKAVCQVS